MTGSPRSLIKIAVNGGRTKLEHPAVPVTAQEVAIDAAAAIAAGADVIHAHARTDDGGQTIEADAVRELVQASHAVNPGVPIGTTTGLWTCDGHEDRMRILHSWHDDGLPDFASVAFIEEGAAEAADYLLERGIVLESAVWSVDDVPALLAAPSLHRNVRILIEPEDEDPVEAVAHARRMASLIRDAGVTVPLCYHGFDQAAWAVITAAFEDGAETRVGFEDMLVAPDGAIAPSNTSMVIAARALEAKVRGTEYRRQP